MPCEIGYRAYASVPVPAPQPQDFRVKAEAPDITANLLEKLGVEDPEFLEWAQELDKRSLLQTALTRALRNERTSLDFVLTDDGMLEARGSFTTTAERSRLEKTASAVSARWQFEILGIVAELLDYSVKITEEKGGLVLEAEEAGKSHPCNYIRVSKRGETADITFEHFKSRKDLEIALAKFETLARTLGVKLRIATPQIREGEPFPYETEGHSHGHAHRHKH